MDLYALPLHLLTPEENEILAKGKGANPLDLIEIIKELHIKLESTKQALLTTEELLAISEEKIVF